MSQYVPFLVSPTQITLTLDGETLVIYSTNKHHDAMLDAIKDSDWQAVRDLADTVKRIEVESDGLITVNDENEILIDDEEAPQVLKDRIMEFADQGLPYEPIKLFWENLKENPSFRARRDLFSFLDHNGHPITEDGCFIAYKRVRDDFKDCHSGTFDNSPGAIIQMDRNSVDDDPTRTCSSGLHVANMNYAQNFYGGGRLLYCKVNPRDVVAIPVDYDNEKMRCCRYEVLSEAEGERREALYRDGSGCYESDFNDGFDSGISQGLADAQQGITGRNIEMFLNMEFDGVSDDFVHGFKEGYDEGLEAGEEELEEMEEKAERYKAPSAGHVVCGPNSYDDDDDDCLFDDDDDIYY